MKKITLATLLLLLAVAAVNAGGATEGEVRENTQSATTTQQPAAAQTASERIEGVHYLDGDFYWTEVANNPFASLQGHIPQMKDIAYGNGRFVIVGSAVPVRFPEPVIAYSDDGINWNKAAVSAFINDQTLDGSRTVECVTWGDNGFVAGDQFGRVGYSRDGANWTAAPNNPFPLRANYSVKAIAYGNGRYVAAGNNKTENGVNGIAGHRTAYSTDGVNWTAADISLPFSSSYQILGMAYGNGRFIMAGIYASSGPKLWIASSTDGTNWARTDYPNFSATLVNLGITFAGGRFLIVADDGSMVSTDGINWETYRPERRASANNPSALVPEFSLQRPIAFGTGDQWNYYFANNRSAKRLLFSPDGLYWREFIYDNIEELSIYEFTVMGYGSARFVAGDGYKLFYTNLHEGEQPPPPPYDPNDPYWGK